MTTPRLSARKQALLRGGMAIPAHPLALTAQRTLDERRQRALTRYYLAAGAGGVAIAVHTTQFAIRDVGLLRPVLELGAETVRDETARTGREIVTIAGVCGDTDQALAEARLAADLGYDAVMPSLGALRQAGDDALIAHCRRLAEIRPLFGFYLQPAVGGRHLSHDFWRRLAEIDNLVAIKIAPFDRYRTLDVVRAIVDSGRVDDVALYTGNDDTIGLDLLMPFRLSTSDGLVTARIVGGLLGHWAVWTRKAVCLVERAHEVVAAGTPVPQELLAEAVQVTDANAAIFDPANAFAGCISGIHEVLRRQGLLAGRWCLDPAEDLSPGQMEEIDRVYTAYPHLNDDAFVAAGLDGWLA
jgi:dihydrodipicolinate synthase/N-acetylneuraminate lyase